MSKRRTVAMAAGATALASIAPGAAEARVQDKLRTAQPLPSATQERQYEKAYKKADRKGDPGRNILAHGVPADGPGDRPARAHDLDRSIGVLKRIVDAPSGATVAGASAASPVLEAIAACESGGDPTAVSADGTYRGKYQFDYGTWASVGGSGDPAAAPEAEQDMRAQMLYDQRGASPWPVCGA